MSWQQLLRPSAHSVLVLGSNVFIGIPIAHLWAARCVLETAVLLASAVASVLYHLCDEQVYCVVPLPVLHYTDVLLMFTAVFVVTALLVGVPLHYRIPLDVVCLLVSAVALAIDRFSPLINGLLWLAPIGTILVSSARPIVRADHTASGAPSSSLSAAAAVSKLPKPAWDRRRMLGGLALLGVGLVCFVLGNVLWPLQGGGAAVPETPVYWLLHSMWHVIGMLGAGRLLSASPLLPRHHHKTA